MPATTIDTALSSDIIASKALEAFSASLAPLSMFSTSFDQDAIKTGDSVQVPLVGGVTASDTQNDYETETGTMQVVSVALTGYAKATVGLTDAQIQSSSVADLEKFATQMANAVAEKVITQTFLKINATNFPSSFTPAAGSTMVKLMRQARSKMNQNKAPKIGRSWLPSQEAMDAIADDETFKFYSTIGDQAFMREGTIQRIMGFDVFEGDVLPAAATTNGFVCHPSALAIATRPVIASKPEAYLEYRVITDKATGIALSLRKHYATGKGKTYFTLECNHGSAVGIKEALLILPNLPA